MSVTIDNATIGPSSGSATASYSHTVGNGSHRYLIVQVNIGPNTVSVQSITYAGVALARLARDTTTHVVELWGLQDPATGANTVAVTLTGTGGNVSAALSFAADAPITVPTTGNTAGSSSLSASLTMTSGQVGDLIVGGVVASSDATLALGETELWNDEAGDAGIAVSGSSAPSTLSWSFTSLSAWGIAAAALRAVSTTAVAVGGLNIPALRAGIAQILATIPQILRVDDKAYPGEATMNLPFAQIERGPLQMHGLSLLGEEADTQLGAYDYLITWTIKVYSSFRNLRDAQDNDDLLAMAVQEAFNSNRLINGLVDNSRVTLITPSLNDDARPKLWISTITLQTLTIASL